MKAAITINEANKYPNPFIDAELTLSVSVEVVAVNKLFADMVSNCFPFWLSYIATISPNL